MDQGEPRGVGPNGIEHSVTQGDVTGEAADDVPARGQGNPHQDHDPDLHHVGVRLEDRYGDQRERQNEGEDDDQGHAA
jgi:hypothetical protein